MRIKKIICAECRKPFTPAREWQKFCCAKCRNDNGNHARRDAFKAVRKSARLGNLVIEQTDSAPTLSGH